MNDNTPLWVIGSGIVLCLALQTAMDFLMMLGAMGGP
jgi:hypothetical protein